MYLISHSFLCNTTPQAFMSALAWELNVRATEEVRNSGRPLKQVSHDRFYRLQSIPDVHETAPGGMEVIFDGHFYSDPEQYSHPKLDPYGYKNSVIEFRIQPTSPNTIKVITGCLNSVSEDDYNELLGIIGELYPESALKTKLENVTPTVKITSENTATRHSGSGMSGQTLAEKTQQELVPLDLLPPDDRKRIEITRKIISRKRGKLGKPFKETCANEGINEKTFRRWREKYKDYLKNP